MELGDNLGERAVRDSGQVWRSVAGLFEGGAMMPWCPGRAQPSVATPAWGAKLYAVQVGEPVPRIKRSGTLNLVA